MVVRGFITGSTKTSLWTHYNNGERTYCGIQFPDGLVKNQQLDNPVITPTTKGVEDVPLSGDEIVENKFMSRSQWDDVSRKALQLFKYGQEIADKQGLLLVDTKYEFGLDEHNNITLIDEVHTCDSSRYWFKENYLEKFNNGEEPEKYDRDVVRDYLKKTVNDPYSEVDFNIPDDLKQKTTRTYLDFYERLTSGSCIKEELKFNTDLNNVNNGERINTPELTTGEIIDELFWENKSTILGLLGGVVIFAGSQSDEKHVLLPLLLGRVTRRFRE